MWLENQVNGRVLKGRRKPSVPLSFQDKGSGDALPATVWLANFLRSLRDFKAAPAILIRRPGHFVHKAGTPGFETDVAPPSANTVD